MKQNYFFVNPALFKPFFDTASKAGVLIDEQNFAVKIASFFTMEQIHVFEQVEMDKVIKYIESNFIPHKIEVLKAGFHLLDKPVVRDLLGKQSAFYVENLIEHDLSKVSPTEIIGYAQHDFKSSAPDPLFDRAWLHHKNMNPHHPEHWMNPDKRGELHPVTMHPVYVVEMVADWIGAGAVYGNSLEEWLPDNLHKFFWTTETALTVQAVLAEIGYKSEIITGHNLYFIK